MKSIFFSVVLIFMVGCASYQVRPPASYENNPYFYDYSMDLTDRSKDLFPVKLTIPHLSAENNGYQFAATVPNQANGFPK